MSISSAETFILMILWYPKTNIHRLAYHMYVMNKITYTTFWLCIASVTNDNAENIIQLFVIPIKGEQPLNYDIRAI